MQAHTPFRRAGPLKTHTMINLTRPFRSSHPELPMVLIFGVSDGDFLREAHRRGAAGALRKPSNFGEVQHMLSGLFSSV